MGSTFSIEKLKSVFTFNKGKGEERITRSITDSREVEPGCLFVARTGEADDGHRFLDDAYQRGARAFIVSADWLSKISDERRESQFAGAVFFGVRDTSQAFSDLARLWRTHLRQVTALVTGSSGKTTTKEMLQSILGQVVGPGTANRKSYNNHVGLPQTLLDASDDERWLVLEAGMNHAGELDKLSEIASPDVAAILNVGPAHLENFKSIDGIADAKCEILTHLKGEVLLPDNNEVLLRGVERREAALDREFTKRFFGMSERAMYRAEQVEPQGHAGVNFTFCCGDLRERVVLPHPGQHNVYNALAALGLAHMMFPTQSLAAFCAALADSSKPDMRCELVRTNGFILVNDAYNANPTSMKAAFDTAASVAEGKGFLAVLGDMLELGESSAALHREVARAAVEAGAKRLVLMGQFAEDFAAGADEAGLKDHQVVQEVEDAAKAILKSPAPSTKVVLIKASRGMALEHVVQALISKLDALPPTVSAE